MNFWESELLLGITLEAEDLVAMDDFITKYSKTGFARVRVKIDSFEPLNPGVLIHGQ